MPDATATRARARPFVSVIVPCRNEERYAARCLESIAATTYPVDRLEALVVDGRSEDRTVEIVSEYAARHPWLRLLDNPGLSAPSALNVGIRSARGDLVVRMDAHASYPPEYLSQLVAAMEETGADNVGGRLVTLPADSTRMARAIACAVSHPLGVGNAHFRIGTPARRWVDTVPFGCYRRDLFGFLGMFDEQLIRNQDDEFNFRLARAGGRILLDPAIVVFYYARATLRELSRVYYHYGYFKPLVARKVGRVMTVRQLVPPAFLACLTGTAAAALATPTALPALGVVLGSYLAAVAGVAIHAARGSGPRFALALLGAFVTLHASYGIGFLRGLGDLVVGRHRAPTSRPVGVPSAGAELPQH